MTYDYCRHKLSILIIRYLYWDKSILLFFPAWKLQGQSISPIWAIFPGYIHFETHSHSLNPDSKEDLKNLALILSEDSILFEPFRIKVSTYYCTKEADLDLYIGLKRAKLIIDFLEEHTGYARRRFLIYDPGPDIDSTNSVECPISAVHVSLID